MTTPLLDRINRRNHDPLCGIEGVLCGPCMTADIAGRPKPLGSRRPVWLDRLTDQDRTATIYSDGENR